MTNSQLSTGFGLGPPWDKVLLNRRKDEWTNKIGITGRIKLESVVELHWNMQAAFVAKLSDAESEAAETQMWLDFSLECKYIDQELFDRLDDEYAKIIGQLIRMINDPGKWTLKR